MVRIKLIIILFFVCSISFGQTSPRSGLINYLKFEETSGSTAFDEKQDNNGVNSNATVNHTGKVGKCYLYNGSSSYISMPDFVDEVWTDISISVWVKADNSTTAMSVFGFNASSPFFALRFYPTNEIRFYLGNGAATPYIETTSYTVTDWNHIVMTAKENDVAQLYINGEFVDDMAISTFYQLATTQQNNIGSVRGGGSLHFDGLIDEFLFVNRILSAIEIKQLYNSGNGLLYIQENLKNNYYYEEFINYFFNRMYYGFVTGAKY